MSYFRYIIIAVICLGITNPAYGDLFLAVEVRETGPQAGFERWLVVYYNRTPNQFLVHIQVDNPNCSVAGEGVLVQVRNSSGNTVKRAIVPGYEARALSFYVPANGRIRVKFLGNTHPDGFDTCNSSNARGYYSVSEPIPTSPLS